MPRNVRNFWLDASIDGRSSDLSGGPVAKDGGFNLKLLQRSNGDILDGGAETVNIRGVSDGDEVILRIDIPAGFERNEQSGGSVRYVRATKR